MRSEDNDEAAALEMDGKTARWLIAAITAVIITCMVGCTATFVANPKEFMCVTSNTKACEEATTP